MSYGNMNKMMKQVQEMQSKMARLQEELENKQVDASAGGGMVSVTASGKLQVTAIKINPEAADPEDVEMLEDLVLAAVNEALRKAQDMVSEEMSKITGGLKVPGLF